jgi:hypothetical protein
LLFGFLMGPTAALAQPGVTYEVVHIGFLSHPMYLAGLELRNATKEPCELVGILRQRDGCTVMCPFDIDPEKPPILGPGKSGKIQIEVYEEGELVGQTGEVICREPAGAVNGLEGELEVKSKGRANTDIGVKFTVAAAGDSAVVVWDTKYSEGYRSWAIVVVTPAGKEVVLRRAPQDAWDKNAPRRVVVAPRRPYVLEGWGMVHGEETKDEGYVFSLNKLGLDTTTKGKYSIHGRFEQPGGAVPKGDPRCMWSGKLTTGTVIVELK